VRWATGKTASGYSSPVATTIGGQRVIFAMTADSLLAIRATDGKLTDTFDWATRFSGNIATPLVVEEYVFISSAYGMGCALLRAELQGDEVKLVPVYARRRPPGMQNHHATSVYKDRYIYGFDGDTVARLRCVEFATGKFKEDWDAGREVEKGS